MYMKNSPSFELEKTTPSCRHGLIRTAHGDINTPVFMPVATAGAMKGITLPDLETFDAPMLLCNTYHLHLSPGEKLIRECGGLHDFIGWKRPILTDSGGFQVFSLRGINTIEDRGVTFRDHRSGAERFIGPREAMEIQHALDSDIIMCFDECPPSTAARAVQVSAVERTLRWAKECKLVHEELKEKNGTSPLLFAIVQGGLEEDLRRHCAEELIAMNFDGYAIGGLAVGESEEDMYRVLSVVCPLLPKDKPRYLMGVGERHQLDHAFSLGIDMADCVSPMREARHGNIWLSDGTKLRIRRREFQNDTSPIDIQSIAPTSQRHTRAYLHHLMRLGERYGETLACLQNMAVMMEWMRGKRGS